MFKRLKFFPIFMLMAFVVPCFANSGNNVLPQNEQPPCLYQTPTNFQPVLRGTDYISLAWMQLGPPPPAYNIKTYQISNNLLISDITFPNTSTGYTVTGLQPGTSYRFELRTVDPNGVPCDYPAISIGNTIILDLLVVNYGADDPRQNPLCSTPAPNTKCGFSTSGTSIFKVWSKSNKNDYKEFHVRKLPSGVYRVEINEQGVYTFQCDVQEDPYCEGSSVEIKKNGLFIATFKFEADAFGNPFLFCTNLFKLPNNNQYPYEIALISGGGQGGYAGNNDKSVFETVERSSISLDEEKDHLSAAPNPFTNLLDVNIPFSSEGNDVQISLYNLQGRMMTNVRIPGGTPTHTLSTENLLPGFYLLRVDTGDRSETIKVMKTQ